MAYRFLRKDNKCWLCNKIREVEEHHIVPKILKRFVPDIEKYKIWICKSCHNKVHLLLPKFFSDGSYKWKGKVISEVANNEIVQRDNREKMD